MPVHKNNQIDGIKINHKLTGGRTNKGVKMSYTIEHEQSTELTTHTIESRLSAGAIDELYIECFLDNPSSKVGALRKAAELAGVECNVSRSRAQQIHRRLQYKIDQGLTKRIIEGATLGYSVLYKMAADENTGEAVRAKCASLLIEYAGKNKIDKTNQETRSRGNILDDIRETQKRINSITGNK